MSVTVPLEDLRDELGLRSALVYLLTVGDDGRPHCVEATVRWTGDDLEVLTGTTSARNARARPDVTLLAPPAAAATGDPGGAADSQGTSGYSLIVDGRVAASTLPSGGGGVVTLRPTRAVLRRSAVGPDGRPAHDCVHVLDGSAGAP